MSRTELVIQLLKVAARPCDWRVFRLVEPGSAAEVAALSVNRTLLQHQACMMQQGPAVSLNKPNEN
jgi:hypothetical protein